MRTKNENEWIEHDVGNREKKAYAMATHTHSQNKV